MENDNNKTETSEFKGKIDVAVELYSTVIKQKEDKITPYLNEVKTLSIINLSDKDGYLAVTEARKKLKEKRITLSKEVDHLMFQGKEFLSKLKFTGDSLISKIKDVECSLSEKEDWYLDGVKKEKLRKEAEEKQKIERRIATLTDGGYKIGVLEYILGTSKVTYKQITTMTNEQWESLCQNNILPSIENHKQELEQEKLKKEAEEKEKIRIEEETKNKLAELEKINQQLADKNKQLESQNKQLESLNKVIEKTIESVEVKEPVKSITTESITIINDDDTDFTTISETIFVLCTTANNLVDRVQKKEYKILAESLLKNVTALKTIYLPKLNKIKNDNIQSTAV